jgi:hypothetical protein
MHSNDGARLRQEILLLPESLQNRPVLSQEGEKHCTDLTPNVSVIPGVESAPQVQQDACENFMQNGPELRETRGKMELFRKLPGIARDTRQILLGSRKPRIVASNMRRDPERIGAFLPIRSEPAGGRHVTLSRSRDPQAHACT